MKIKFTTLGCKVNQYETQVMLEAMLAAGYTAAAEDEPADVVVVNSCTVTAQSDQKARQALRRLKRENPGAVAVLTGCFPQAFPEKALALPEADVVLGTGGRARLPQAVADFLASRQRVESIPPHTRSEGFEPMSVTGFQGRTRAFLKIEDGCDRFCSYCIIPFARGRVRSKPPEDIRREAAALAAAGYREVVLAGINLPCYGQDLGLTLCDGVEAACAVPGILRVRLSSLEPEQLTPPVIARLRAQEKLCPQFHLSLQSGCEETLRRMDRRYTPAAYRQITQDLRAAFPGCALTTDVMVGFPGETEAEFAASLAFVREIAFAKVHVFVYSRRPGTRAWSAPDPIPRPVQEDRSRRMIAAAAETRRAFLLSQVGQVQPVLFEQPVAPGLYEGYTENYTPVRAASAQPLAGQILPVRLERLGEDWVEGTPVP